MEVLMPDVVKFPIKGWQRTANRRGKLSASCIVSDRWLRFAETSHKMPIGSAVWVDVMTDASGEEKICSLAITVEELQRVLANIKDDGAGGAEE